jgi:hypothetical protein
MPANTSSAALLVLMDALLAGVKKPPEGGWCIAIQMVGA